MAFMVAAYLVIWLAAFVFILSMVQRQRNIQREIAALRELAQEQGRDTHVVVRSEAVPQR